MPIPFVVAVDLSGDQPAEKLDALDGVFTKRASPIRLNSNTWLVSSVNLSTEQIKNLVMETCGSDAEAVIVHLLQVQSWCATPGHPAADSLARVL